MYFSLSSYNYTGKIGYILDEFVSPLGDDPTGQGCFMMDGLDRKLVNDDNLLRNFDQRSIVRGSHKETS